MSKIETYISGHDVNYHVNFAKIPSKEILNLAGPKSSFKVDSTNAINGYYHKLEKRILEKGFDNPILVVVGSKGWSDHPYYKKYKQWSNKPVCLEFGGDELYIAQKHNLEVPVIMTNYLKNGTKYPRILSLEKVGERFSEKPKSIWFDEKGIHLEMRE